MRCGSSCSFSTILSLTFILNHHSSAFTATTHHQSGDFGRHTFPLLAQGAAAIESPGATSLDFDGISVTLPHDWEERNHASWSMEAAATLNKHGVVALISQSDKGGDGLIKSEVCDDANHSAFSRVKEMHKRIKSRGMDPSGAEEPYRFAEIVCRDEGGRRYDVPLPWLVEDKDNDEEDSMGAVGSKRIGAPLESSEEEAFAQLHESIGRTVSSVMDDLWPESSDESSTSNQSYVAAAGFLMNKPGSASQNWHRDGPDEGYIDCFVPLIDLNESVGPTAIQPGTHTAKTSSDDSEQKDVLIPLLKKGDILLFDYRTIHRGLGNKSEGTTRTLAYAVFKRKEGKSSNDSGDVHNFPAALTLEYD